MLLLSTAVAAQPSERTPPDTQATVEGARPDDPVRATVLTPQVMSANARLYGQRMAEIEDRVEVLLDQSQRKRDIIKINCLTDKLVQIRANLQIADKALRSMQQDLGDGNEPAAFTAYRRVSVANLNVQVLGTEAETCVGEDLSVVGVTDVRVESEGVPTNDPTQPPSSSPSDDDLARPPHASPYY